MFAYLNRLMSFHVIQYMTSILPQHMAEVYGMNASQVSYLLLVQTGACTISFVSYAFFCGPAILSLIPRRLLYVFSLFIATIAYILCGPSVYLGLPDESFPLLIIGLALVGASMGPTVVNTLPEALDTWKVAKNHCEGVDPYLDGLMTDVFSSIHVQIKCFMAAASPILAGAINDAYGWQGAMAFSYCLIFTFCLLNWCFNAGCHPYHDKRMEVEKLKMLSQKTKR